MKKLLVAAFLITATWTAALAGDIPGTIRCANCATITGWSEGFVMQIAVPLVRFILA